MSTIHSANLNIVPNDLLISIGRFLASHPKDLVNFGKVCKKFNNVLKNEVFSNLLKLCQEIAPLQKRVRELRGPMGWGGEIDEAADKKILIKTQMKQIVKISNPKNGDEAANLIGHGKHLGPARSALTFLKRKSPFDLGSENEEMIGLFKKLHQNEAKLKKLKNELSELANYDSNNEIVSGKIWQLNKKIEQQIEKIQESVK